MAIYVNQVGYGTASEKIAIMKDAKSCTLVDEKKQPVAVPVTVVHAGMDEASGDDTWKVDFSQLTKEGTYYLVDENGAESEAIHVLDTRYQPVFRDLCRMLYFQRCGMELEEAYAGKFTHKACHTAPITVYGQPEVKKIMNGGWHDAGDYGRYVTPGAVTIGHMVYAFLMFPEAARLGLSIPESGNGTPDMLNECRYELEWMLQMQYEDGSVSHKLTSQYHTGFIMPEDDPLPFFEYPATSLATADFAACMALSYQAFLPYDKAFAETMLAAAKMAADWLAEHPDMVYVNPKDCFTGDYGDITDVDERLWAYCELYAATREEGYLALAKKAAEACADLTSLGWGDVGGFAGLAVFYHKDLFPQDMVALFTDAFVKKAEQLLAVTKESSYHMAMKGSEFVWGSNLAVMTNSVILSVVAALTGEAAYRQAAEDQFSYLFGRNPLGVSYVTGYGAKPFCNPHNRPTYADGIEEPIPGYVSGGPNKRPADEKACQLIPEGTAPMKCFADVYESYSTNEIAIYWNSIAILAMAALL